MFWLKPHHPAGGDALWSTAFDKEGPNQEGTIHFFVALCFFCFCCCRTARESFQTRLGESERGQFSLLWLLFFPHKPTLSFATSLSWRRFNLYKALDNCRDNFSLLVYEIIKGTFPSPEWRAGFSQAAVDDSEHSFCAWERSWSLAVPCDRVVWRGLDKKNQFHRNHWSCNAMKRIFSKCSFQNAPIKQSWWLQGDRSTGRVITGLHLI